MKTLLKRLPKYPLKKGRFEKIPEKIGVYIFWNDETPVYVGKSINIRKRISSYFITNLGGKTKKMINEANFYSHIAVSSEIEALLLESKLINKLNTKYNIQLKDDKNPLYIAVTNEEYTRVYAIRKIIDKSNSYKNIYGPFPSSTNVRSVLKLIRKIFPYSKHKLGKKACFSSQIGLCSPCPNEINKNKDEKQKEVQKKEYRKNISYIIKILDGKFLNVKNSLDKKMKTLSDNEKFEEAILIRRKIEQLDYITRPINAADSFLKNPNLLDDIRKREVDNLSMIICEYSHKKTVIRRIECYDVAHISGSYPSASMVTFINGEPVKKYYRQFNIRQGKSRSDTASLFEVARRRINHLKDWGIPDLIIVDGGVAQVKTFLKAFNKENIIITGIAKSPDRLIIRSKKGLFNKIILRGPSLFLVQRLRDEAHRFARRYYKKRLQNSLKLTE